MSREKQLWPVDSWHFCTVNSSLVVFLSGMKAAIEGSENAPLLSEELPALFPGQLIAE